MTFQAAEAACAFAWRNYMLLHNCVGENDDRRVALCRYIGSLGDTGKYDFGLLQIAAVAYLKKPDELHEDRDARHAAEEALARTRQEQKEPIG